MRQLSNDGSSTGLPSPNPGARSDVFQYPAQSAHSPAPHYAAANQSAFPATSQAGGQTAYQNQTAVAQAAKYPSQVESQATAYQYAAQSMYTQQAAYSQQYGQDVYGSSPSQYSPHVHPTQSIYDFPPGAPPTQSPHMFPQVYQQHTQNIYGSPDLYRRQSASAYTAPPGGSAYAAQPQYDYLPPGGYGTTTTNGMDTTQSAAANPAFNPFGKDRQHTDSPFQNTPWPPRDSSDC